MNHNQASNPINCQNNNYQKLISTASLQTAAVISDQLRCYLCETPKQEYSLTRAFSEIICRGCLNYEGPDKIELLVADARRSKRQQSQVAVQSGAALFKTQSTSSSTLPLTSTKKLTSSQHKTHETALKPATQIPKAQTSTTNYADIYSLVNRLTPSGTVTNRIPNESQSPNHAEALNQSNALTGSLDEAAQHNRQRPASLAYKSRKNHTKSNSREHQITDNGSESHNYVEERADYSSLPRRRRKVETEASPRHSTSNKVARIESMVGSPTSTGTVEHHQQQASAPSRETQNLAAVGAHSQRPMSIASKPQLSVQTSNSASTENSIHLRQTQAPLQPQAQHHQMAPAAAASLVGLQYPLIRKTVAGDFNSASQYLAQQVPLRDLTSELEQLTRLQWEAGQKRANELQARQLQAHQHLHHQQHHQQRAEPNSESFIETGPYHLEQHNYAALASSALYGSSADFVATSGSSPFHLVRQASDGTIGQASDSRLIFSRAGQNNSGHLKQSPGAPPPSVSLGLPHGYSYPIPIGSYMTAAGPAAIYCSTPYHAYHAHRHTALSAQQASAQPPAGYANSLMAKESGANVGGALFPLPATMIDTSAATAHNLHHHQHHVLSKSMPMDKKSIGETTPPRGLQLQLQRLLGSDTESSRATKSESLAATIGRRRSLSPAVPLPKHKMPRKEAAKTASVREMSPGGSAEKIKLIDIGDSNDGSLIILESSDDKQQQVDKDTQSQVVPSNGDSSAAKRSCGPTNEHGTANKQGRDDFAHLFSSSSPPPTSTSHKQSMVGLDINRSGSSSSSSSLDVRSSGDNQASSRMNLDTTRPSSPVSTRRQNRYQTTKGTNLDKSQPKSGVCAPDTPKSSAGDSSGGRQTNGTNQTQATGASSSVANNEQGTWQHQAGQKDLAPPPSSGPGLPVVAPGSLPLKCMSCKERLEDRHFVQCPSVVEHKFCFACSKSSIELQQLENKKAKQNPERIFCPSGERCPLASEQTPWTFMNSEIETIFRESTRQLSAATSQSKQRTQQQQITSSANAASPSCECNSLVARAASLVGRDLHNCPSGLHKEAAASDRIGTSPCKLKEQALCAPADVVASAGQKYKPVVADSSASTNAEE